MSVQKMKSDFIKELTPAAIRLYYDYGVLPSVTIAQAALETGWGRAARGNNLFGIKVSSDWTGATQVLTTTEEVKGRKVRMKQTFKAYSNKGQSLLDYGKLLNKSRYNAARNKTNWQDALRGVVRGGYATDSQYYNKAASIIRSNGLDAIDKRAIASKQRGEPPPAVDFGDVNPTAIGPNRGGASSSSSSYGYFKKDDKGKDWTTRIRDDKPNPVSQEDDVGTIHDMTLVGNTDYIIYFDAHRVDHLVTGFSANVSIDGGMGTASIDMLYAPNLNEGRSNYKKRNIGGKIIEWADQSWGGIQSGTAVRIFIRNMFSGKYCCVYDGIIRQKVVTRSGEERSIQFTAVDHTSWLNKTVVPLGVPLDDMLYFSDRLRWKGQGIDPSKIPSVSTIGDLNFRGKNIKETWADIRNKAIGRNLLYQQSDAIWFDRPTNRVKQMAEIDKQFTQKNSPMDLLVSTAASSVNSIYVFMHDLVKSMMLEFFQDRDGVIRIKAPYWSQPVLKSHVIDQSLIMSMTEETNWENEFSRVIVTGGLQWYEADLDEATQKILAPVAVATTDGVMSNIATASDSFSAPAVDKEYKVVSNGITGTWLDNYKITSRQGMRNGRMHNGVDFAGNGMSTNTNILHVGGPGVVEKVAYQASGAGLYVNVRIQSGAHNGYLVQYFHMSRIDVKEGQQVVNASILGKAGSTGRSTGVHLHLGVKAPSGKYADVMSYLMQVGSGVYEGQQMHISDMHPTEGDELLEPTLFEKKYGVNIFTMDQPMIKFSQGMGASNWEQGKHILGEYARYLIYYLNATARTGSLQIIAMPWLRPGFNIWVDPIGMSRFYYVNSISYFGNAQGGCYMNLGLIMGRNANIFLKNTPNDPIRNIGAKNEGNVFLTEILPGYRVSSGDFGPIVGDKSHHYYELRDKMLKIRMGLSGTQHVSSKDSMDTYKTYYNTQNMKMLMDLYAPGAPAMFRSGGDVDEYQYRVSGAEKENVSGVKTSDVDKWRDLKKGHRGEDVKQLQAFLNAAGFNTGMKPDGIFGAKTENALKAYQKSMRIQQTGVCGPTTRDRGVKKTILASDVLSSRKSVRDTDMAKPANMMANVNIKVETWRKNMKLGDRGADVAGMQKFLKDRGFYTGNNDGIFGAKTRDAVKRFQRKVNIAADGICGVKTRTMLEQYYYGKL